MCDVATYYAGAAWSALSGSALLAALHTHVSTGTAVVPYTSSTKTDAWDGLAVLDADPAKESRVIELYAQASVNASDHTQATGWNREHVWPKSFGVFYEGADYSDLHHLRASDWNVNSARGNKPFGECTPSVDASCKSPAHVEAAPDTATNPSIWQPPAAVRGDIARALFFMVARYDGSEVNTLPLVLTSCAAQAANAMGNLTTLLQWHLEDPADAREVWRTEQVCERYQGNRNPFIDDAALAERVWGDGSGFVDAVCAGTFATGPSPMPSAAPSPKPSLASDAQAGPCLLLTAVVDGDMPGGLPKAVELFAACDVADTSEFGLGSANNGGGSDGEEFTFPSVPGGWARGDFVYVAYESGTYPNSFETFFGFAPSFTATALYVNGDDALELFWRGAAVDVYGEATSAGGGAWAYTDGWAYRIGHSPQGNATAGAAWVAGDWDVRSGALLGAATNSAAASQGVPVGAYRPPPTPAPTPAPTPTPMPTLMPTLMPALIDGGGGDGGVAVATTMGMVIVGASLFLATVAVGYVVTLRRGDDQADWTPAARVRAASNFAAINPFAAAEPLVKSLVKPLKPLRTPAGGPNGVASSPGARSSGGVELRRQAVASAQGEVAFFVRTDGPTPCPPASATACAQDGRAEAPSDIVPAQRPVVARLQVKPREPCSRGDSDEKNDISSVKKPLAPSSSSYSPSPSSFSLPQRRPSSSLASPSSSAIGTSLDRSGESPSKTTPAKRRSSHAKKRAGVV